MNNFEGVDKILSSLNKINVSKMDIEDQFKFALAVIEFTKSVKPIVDKYYDDSKDIDNTLNQLPFSFMVENINK